VRENVAIKRFSPYTVQTIYSDKKEAPAMRRPNRFATVGIVLLTAIAVLIDFPSVQYEHRISIYPCQAVVVLNVS